MNDTYTSWCKDICDAPFGDNSTCCAGAPGGNPCHNDAVCEDEYLGYTCSCVSGFSGTLCDECGYGKGYNQTSGACEFCPHGYVNAQISHRAPCAPLGCPPGEGHTSDIAGDLPSWNNTKTTNSDCQACPQGTVSQDNDGQCVTCTEGLHPNEQQTACLDV